MLLAKLGSERVNSPTDTRFKRAVAKKSVKESQAGILPEKSLKPEKSKTLIFYLLTAAFDSVGKPQLSGITHVGLKMGKLIG